MSFLTIVKKIYDLLTGTGVKVDDISAGTQSYSVATSDYGYDGSTWVPIKVDASGKLMVK